MRQGQPESVSDLCQRLWELESDLDLLNREFRGVLLWQASRMHIYYKLAEACGLYEAPHAMHRPGARQLWRKFAYLLRDLTRDNPFFRSLPAEVGVFAHNRSQDIAGSQQDIYTHYLCRELNHSRRSFIRFERPFLNEYKSAPDPNSRHIGAIESLCSVLAKLPCARLTRPELAGIDQLRREIKSRFAVDIDLRALFKLQLQRFRLRRFLYGRLLDRYQVREVYLVISYYLAPLIDSCKSRGIPVYELQHGVINRYHLGYSFPGSAPGSLRYFPDYLLAWGGSWPRTRHLPLPPDRIIDYGFKHFDASVKAPSSRPKHQDRVLVVSQSVHGNALARFIRDNIDKFRGWKIIYKLHPSEFNRAESYPDLDFLKHHVRDFELVTRGDVHSLLAECGSVVGVFSTVLYEALAFQCQVYVCPLNGWEYMDEVLEDGRVRPFEEFAARDEPTAHDRREVS